jgi:antitoxin VapB
MSYAVQIANPQLVQKIEWLAQTLQLGKTAVVDRAVDLLTAQYKPLAGAPDSAKAKELAAIEAVLAKAQQIPDRNAPAAPLEWDAQGLPV